MFNEHKALENIAQKAQLTAKSDIDYLTPVATGDIKQAIYEAVDEMISQDFRLRQAIQRHYAAIRPRKVPSRINMDIQKLAQKPLHDMTMRELEFMYQAFFIAALPEKYEESGQERRKRLIEAITKKRGY